MRATRHRFKGTLVIEPAVVVQARWSLIMGNALEGRQPARQQFPQRIRGQVRSAQQAQQARIQAGAALPLPPGLESPTGNASPVSGGPLRLAMALAAWPTARRYASTSPGPGCGTSSW